eukprot:m.266100 g.266100  ORF g.266100 m.266100 type:complete len:215 (+) comp65456_c0_seq1:235-879(+)
MHSPTSSVDSVQHFGGDCSPHQSTFNFETEFLSSTSSSPRTPSSSPELTDCLSPDDSYDPSRALQPSTEQRLQKPVSRVHSQTARSIAIKADTKTKRRTSSNIKYKRKTRRNEPTQAIIDAEEKKAKSVQSARECRIRKKAFIQTLQISVKQCIDREMKTQQTLRELEAQIKQYSQAQGIPYATRLQEAVMKSEVVTHISHESLLRLGLDPELL